MDLDLRVGTIGPSSGEKERETRVAVAGGGPAGLTAALYLARYRIDHLVLEGWQPGGQAALTDRIENYPGIASTTGSGLVESMREQAVSSGSVFLSDYARGAEAAGGSFRVATDSGVIVCRSLVIATGAAPAKLGVPGEEEFSGRGVSYCATCDAPFFRDRRLMVIGGGDSAVKEALHLTGFASSVTVVHRRDALRAEPALAEKILSHPKCSVMWSSRLLEIRGGPAGVEAAVLETPGGRVTVEIDGIFIYVGRRPATEPFRDLVRLNGDGTVWTTDHVRTSREAVYAAGDVTANPLRQVVTAAADGARAAAAAWHFLELGS